MPPCCAALNDVVRLPDGRAREHQLTSKYGAAGGSSGGGTVGAEGSVTITFGLQHTGHTPGSAADMVAMPLHTDIAAEACCWQRAQLPEQQRMLKLYGDTIVSMDATYKTTKWGFPLFLITVVDNHGHG
eukprot:XP_001701409.1 predicted protein [Chlamydomonas reinhardtii]